MPAPRLSPGRPRPIPSWPRSRDFANIFPRRDTSEERYSFSRKVVFPLSIYIVVFLILTLFTFIGRRSYEGKYISAVTEERNQIVKELMDLSLIGTDIKTISNIEFPINPDIEIIMMLTLQSLDCRSCAAEAAYLEYLNDKYGRKIFICAVVRKIGKKAIDNIRSEYSITYPFVEDPVMLGYKIFSRYKSLIIIVSKDRKIMRMDPIDFNVKKIQDEYESVLLSYLK